MTNRRQPSKMLDLRTIWSNRLNLIVANLKFDEREHREVAVTAQHVRWDYHGRFLVELLQNAADQAVRAGLTDSKVLIIRTSEFLAVLNQGSSLDDEGLRALTSLAYDTKDPALTIGNKGLGFKAVFQVSDAPEVYSAPVEWGGLLAEGGYRFAFAQRPMENPTLRGEVKRVAAEFERESPLTAERIREQHGGQSFDEVLLTEASHGAPFRFPLPRDEAELLERVGALGLSADDVALAGALVVLPLKDGAEVQRWVDEAITELINDQFAASVLFLSGVGELRCDDHCQGVTYVLERRAAVEPSLSQRVPGHGRISYCVTRRLRATFGAAPEVRECYWWVCSRTLGEPADSDPETASGESKRILDAVAVFPGEHWARVSQATVDVALPVPTVGRPRGRPLGATGLFCIGLPTRMGTGTPLWVNARFHGNIARTEVDFAQNDYNQILFDEAVGLADDLVQALKTAGDSDTRRLATLAVETAGDGALGREFREPDGLAGSEVVLGADGITFMCGRAVAMPREQDVSMFRLLCAANPVEDRFALADEWLMLNARTLLRQLGATEGPAAGPDLRYTERESCALSLLERGARLHRVSGPSFWDPFLNWLLERFPARLLADQLVLPAGIDALASPAEKVYATPLLPASALAERHKDDPQRLDRVIAQRLLLFDERCVPVREGDGVRYTPLGNRLRQTEPPLLFDPALSELVREVLGPRIQELTSEPGREAEAISLLKMVAEWAQARGITDLPRTSLRVPVVENPPGSWVWASPARAYLGEGWQDPETDALLARAYGASPGRLLVPWAQFAAVAGAGDDEREWWISALATLGVFRQPRVHRHSHLTAPFQAYSYTGPLFRATNVRCPISRAEAQWSAYLEAIRHRRANVASGQPYDVEQLLWIDGLEIDDARPYVIELVLRRHQQFERFLTTKLSRSGGRGDSTDVPSLWAHTLEHSGWRVIPTNRGLVAPSDAWLLVGEQRKYKQGRYRFLPCVAEFAEPAERILSAVGVAKVDEAPPERYIRALQDLAARLDALSADEISDAIVLTEELYRELQSRLASNTVDLPILGERPLPMFDGIERHRLRTVDLRDPPIILVDDNPIRARFVQGAHRAAMLPISPRRGHAALVTAIEAITGEGSVSYTRAAPVQVSFQASGSPDTTVAAFLERAYPAHPLRRDLALLLALVSTSATDISSDTVRAALRRFDTVWLHFGIFGPDAGTLSFFDEHDRQGPVLLVDQSLQSVPDQVFAATWQLIGAHRDLWASYALALRDGVTARFFTERGVTAADIHDAEVVVDPTRATRFAALQPAILAIGLVTGATIDATRFRAEWSEHLHTPDELARWIGREDLADALARGAAMDDLEAASLYVLEAAGVSADEWQRARQLLGLPNHNFARSREAFQRARDLAAAALMATASRAVSVDLPEARKLIEQIQALQPSADLLHLPCDAAAMLPHVLKAAQASLEAGHTSTLTVLASRLEEAIRAGEAGVAEALQRRVPQREVDEYRLPEEVRTSSAQRDVSIVLDCSQRLAPLLGETVDVHAIRQSGRVAALASGWWANRFTVLDGLRQVLEDVAPLTTKRLSEERAFRDPGPPGALAGRISELADAVPRPGPTAPTPGSRVVDVIGVRLVRGELDGDLAKGSEGRVGAGLRAHVKRVDFDDLRGVESPPVRSAGGRGGWSGRRRGTRSGAESHDDREINGLLGEAFVYELFREQLPGFDFQCWRSTNAVRYGAASEGDDSLGADFIYRDLSGVLTGRADAPEVYLEVKATSEEGTIPFDISEGEWDTARRIHLENARRLYAIIRVEHVRSAPALHRILVDPVRLERDGLLEVERKDLRIYCG